MPRVDSRASFFFRVSVGPAGMPRSIPVWLLYRVIYLMPSGRPQRSWRVYDSHLGHPVETRRRYFLMLDREMLKRLYGCLNANLSMTRIAFLPR